MIARTILKLAKENFKFSAAHFMIFDSTRAERLHGHNYYIQVELEFNARTKVKAGFTRDFKVLKKIIRAEVDRLDEYIMLPTLNPSLKIRQKGRSVEVQFRKRLYLFPKDEVRLLPTTNTSVEEISNYLALRLDVQFRALNLERLQVSVEESRGQSGTTILQKSQ